jgi:hypothetical protein
MAVSCEANAVPRHPSTFARGALSNVDWHTGCINLEFPAMQSELDGHARIAIALACLDRIHPDAASRARYRYSCDPWSGQP